MSEWNGENRRVETAVYTGPDRRKDPQPFEILRFLREELDEREEKLNKRLDALSDTQVTVLAKVKRWEDGAMLLRWVTLAIIGAITIAMKVVEWTKEHVR